MLFLLLVACPSELCADATGEHAAGTTWTCEDGCNTCSCEDGEVVGTLMGCVASCTDETGTYDSGGSWGCPDGCNTCGCMEGGVITATEMACDGRRLPLHAAHRAPNH